MRERLVSKLDPEELTDLSQLMPAIQQLMHTVHKAEHPMKKVWGDLKKLLDCKQQPGETHDQYVNKIIDQQFSYDMADSAQRTEVAKRYGIFWGIFVFFFLCFALA